MSVFFTKLKSIVPCHSDMSIPSIADTFLIPPKQNNINRMLKINFFIFSPPYFIILGGFLNDFTINYKKGYFLNLCKTKFGSKGLCKSSFLIARPKRSLFSNGMVLGYSMYSFKRYFV